MDGVIVLNKSRGVTSSQVCLQVKKLLGAQKIGHAGTLDPMATGVLPLCLNEGTKIVQFIMTGKKEYVATMRLGVTTDTQDSQGAVVERSEHIPRDSGDICRVIHACTGDMLQTPPMFSALKRNGVPLYKLARQGMTVQRERRRISVFEIEVMHIDIPSVTFRVACSSGTYVRTLCHDMGAQLGCGAHMTALARVRSGPFHLDRAVTMEDLAVSCREGAAQRHIMSPADALKGLPAVVVNAVMEKKIRNGGQITLDDISSLDLSGIHRGQQLKVLSFGGKLIGVVEALAHEGRHLFGDMHMKAWKTLRVFQ